MYEAGHFLRNSSLMGMCPNLTMCACRAMLFQAIKTSPSSLPPDIIVSIQPILLFVRFSLNMTG